MRLWHIIALILIAAFALWVASRQPDAFWALFPAEYDEPNPLEWAVG